MQLSVTKEIIITKIKMTVNLYWVGRRAKGIPLSPNNFLFLDVNIG